MAESSETCELSSLSLSLSSSDVVRNPASASLPDHSAVVNESFCCDSAIVILLSASLSCCLRSPSSYFLRSSFAKVSLRSAASMSLWFWLFWMSYWATALV